MNNDAFNEAKSDIELINQYTRKELAESDVYTFSVTLCDNEVDRDFEAFTKEALDGLSSMFLGKTGIFDHDMKAAAQSARVYKTWTEEMPGVLTSYGETYCCLKAKAYMVRTDANKALIDEIDGGIKKEVSVSCSMRKTVCSVCGKDLRSCSCEHVKGEIYNGKLCYGILTEPGDAYEWSFVAVPAQRMAGVTKSFIRPDHADNALRLIKSAVAGVVLSVSQTQAVKDYIASLEAAVQEAEDYRESLRADIRKYALIVMPSAGASTFMENCGSMTAKQLRSVRDALEKQALNIIPPTIQLNVYKNSNKESYKEYTI